MARIGADEWAAFRTCRRQWDYGSPRHRNLEPVSAVVELDLVRAVKDALAVYYFPGMWDWPRTVVHPLVMKAFDRVVSDQEERVEASPPAAADRGIWEHAKETGRALVSAYVETAPALDRFAPVLIEAEFTAPIPDPMIPGAGLAEPSGAGVDYAGTADVVVVDEYDAYWVLRHRVVRDWTPIENLRADDTAVVACWAWERCYLGMTIAGTIDNEVALATVAAGGPPAGSGHRVAQREGSGGGRSVPQHRRLSARANEPANPPTVEVETAPGIRRVWMRRSPEQVGSVAAALSVDAAAMVSPSVSVPPRPSAEWCGRCPFLRPCIEVMGGRDPDDALSVGYRSRPEGEASRSRLGARTWSLGRGAAPPSFRGRSAAAEYKPPEMGI
jgi:hypothetical protein